MSFSLDDVAYLAAHNPRIQALAPSIALTKSSVFADRALLDREFGEYARAVSVLIYAQRAAAAAGKFPADWLTDYDAAQQATPRLVSDVRAERIASFGASLVHDVTCSVGSEAPAFLDRGVDWLGSDIDRARVAIARHNLLAPDDGGAAAGSLDAGGARAWLAVADALAPVSADTGSGSSPGSNSGSVITADPARRADGRRITDPAKLIPPLPSLLDAYRPGGARQGASAREMAIKCAPGIDYSEWDGLVSVVSVDGGVKEACLYTPGFGRGREAVVLRTGSSGDTGSSSGADFTERVTADLPAEAPVTGPGTYIVEPDGAVIRAGLVNHWATRHGLSMLDEHIAFTTGDTIPAGYSGFPFIEAVPLKKLKAALAAHRAGSLEILVRGVDVDPDQLRKKLKLKGSNPMAVVIARIGDTAVAHICGPRLSV